MNILVCFKIVKDYDDILIRDWQSIKKISENNLPTRSDPVDMSYAKWKLNDFDESGLELALFLKDKEKNIKTTALTIGKDIYDPILKNLLAVGIDEVYHLLEEKSFFSQTEVAKIIYSFTEKSNTKYDLIILGSSAGNFDYGVTPQILGELMEYPVITQVVEGDYSDDFLTIRSEVDSGIKETIFTPPAVISMGNAKKPNLRYATIREKMKSRDKNVIKQEVKYENKEEFILTDLYYEKITKESVIYKEEDFEKYFPLLLEEIGRKK